MTGFTTTGSGFFVTVMDGMKDAVSYRAVDDAETDGTTSAPMKGRLDEGVGAPLESAEEKATWALAPVEMVMVIMMGKAIQDWFFIGIPNVDVKRSTPLNMGLQRSAPKGFI